MKIIRLSDGLVLTRPETMQAYLDLVKTINALVFMQPHNKNLQRDLCELLNLVYQDTKAPQFFYGEGLVSKLKWILQVAKFIWGIWKAIWRNRKKQS